ncbi:MAG: hypothetical protein JNM76_05705 [Betaproteobacteria bacterium]|nr:hypothetical protein [Betaproteobacteria bacterium]
MWRSALRIAVQLVLVAPVLFFSPFALTLAVASLLAVATIGPKELDVILTFVLSGLSLPFLLMSILLTTRALRRSPWRWLVTIGLVAGVIGTVLWLVGTGGANQPGRIPYDTWTLYLFGGPVAVAGWNLWRAWRAEPPDAPGATSAPEAASQETG